MGWVVYKEARPLAVVFWNGVCVEKEEGWLVDRLRECKGEHTNRNLFFFFRYQTCITQRMNWTCIIDLPIIKFFSR